MKKKFSFFFIIILFSTQVFAKASTGGSIFPSLKNTKKLLDLPLVGGITQFATMIYRFTKIVAITCVLFAFLMIVFNSFKLWMGTVEVKKSFVDMVYKCMLCIGIFAVYIPLTNSALALANTFGTSCSGGYQKINHVYTEAYKSLKAQIDEGLKEIKSAYIANAFTDTNNKKFISNTAFEKLINFGMTKKEAEDWAKNNGISIAHEETEYDNAGLPIPDTSESKSGWYDSNGNKITQKNNFLFWSWTSGAKLQKNDKKINKSINTKKQEQLICKINGLLAVLEIDEINEIASSENSQAIDDAQKTIKKIFYSPWLKNENNVNTFFISPNAILKTILVMSDAVAYGSGSTINEQGELTDKELNVKGVWTWKGVFSLISTLLYKLGMGIAAVIIMAEYTITILSFFIIRALATLLIPLLFLDATKSFAQNLLRLLLTYFIKILVVVMCCFFSLGMYMDCISVVFNSVDDINATLTIIMYLSTIVLGLMLSFNAPQLASAIINGHPAMGVGDIAHIGRSMGHAMHTANHMVRSARHFGSSLAHNAQGFARGTAGLFSTLDSAFVAGRNAGNRINASGEWGGTKFAKFGAQAGAFASTLGQAAKQKLGDSAHKAIFGTERHHFNKNNTEGFWHVGQQVMIGGYQKIATTEDVIKHNREIAQKNGENSFNNALNNNRILPDKDRKIPWPENGK